jgi:hypothetical protein
MWRILGWNGVLLKPCVTCYRIRLGAIHQAVAGNDEPGIDTSCLHDAEISNWELISTCGKYLSHTMGNLIPELRRDPGVRMNTSFSKACIVRTGDKMRAM